MPPIFFLFLFSQSPNYATCTRIFFAARSSRHVSFNSPLFLAIRRIFQYNFPIRGWYESTPYTHIYLCTDYSRLGSNLSMNLKRYAE